MQAGIGNEKKEAIMVAIKQAIMENLAYTDKDHRLSVLDKMRKINFGDVDPKKFAQAIIDNLPRVFKTIIMVSRRDAIRRFHNQNVGDQSRLLIESVEMLVAEGFTGREENDKI